ETLPAAVDSAYADAEKLVMELDMDDLDRAQMEQAVADLAMLPAGQTLQQQLGAQVYDRFVATTRTLGVDAAMLDRFRPWFAAITLVQLQLMKMGFDPESGVERRLTARAAADSKPIQGLETARGQLEIIARPPETEQGEILR